MRKAISMVDEIVFRYGIESGLPAGDLTVEISLGTKQAA
jgi:hypothetical protein